ncbi:mitochondrial ribosomal protein L11 [Thalictrum thalictroides]|uniref:Large ribosomal subunit protein uL11m n=1 Tax=Thalictrum thalictroides TaxID=46969 RepID=A0A7J6X870_THATH|nr:mitochondrial ribosomal protein L11 [Thalictrum thalictroides]
MASLKKILLRRPVATTIRLTVPAGAAQPAPPIRPALGHQVSFSHMVPQEGNRYESGSRRPGHIVASTLTLKHIYEIAKIKQSNPYYPYMSLESISKSIIGTANSIGIKVQKELD